MKPLRWWVDEYERVGAETFPSVHPVPFLLLISKPQHEEPAEEAAAKRKFRTMRLGKSSDVLLDPLDLPVYPVRKIEGRNVFGMMITVGRATNNDLEVDQPGVSKFHAYLEERDGRWCLKDANSKNGTFVAGRQLSKDESCPLEDGVTVRFARVACRFQTCDSFCKVLASELARKRPSC